MLSGVSFLLLFIIICCYFIFRFWCWKHVVSYIVLLTCNDHVYFYMVLSVNNCAFSLHHSPFYIQCTIHCLTNVLHVKCSF